MKTFIKKNIIYWALLLFLCAYEAMQLPQSPLFSRYDHDSSVYQYVGKMMLEGQILYKDVFDHKGPLVYLWHTCSYAVHPMYGLYFFETIWLFLSALLAFSLTKKYHSPLVAFGIVCAVFSTIPVLDTIGNTESLALLPLIALLYIFSQAIQNQKINIIESSLTGFLAAFLLLIKPIYLCAPMIYILSQLLFFYRRKQYDSLKNLILYGGVCGLLPILFTILYFYHYDALQDLWECYIEFNTKYAMYFSKIHSTNPIITIKTLSNEALVRLGLVTAIFVALKLNKITSTQKYITLTLLITFIASLVVTILPNNPFPHYTMILLPLVLMLTCVGIKFFSEKKALTILGLILIFGLHVTYSFLSQQTISLIDIKRREVANFIQNKFRDNEKIIVLEHHTVIYLYSDKSSATKYPYPYAPNTIMPEKVTSEIHQSSAPLVLYRWHIHDYNIHYEQYIPVYENEYYIVAVHE